MSAEIIALGVGLFVTLAVGGWRLIDALDAQRKREEADRRRQITARANRSDYHGPRYSHRGAEIGE